MTTQEMLAPLRKAINDYKMINDDDRIVVGVSGGKDSLTLLSLLAAYKRFAPEKFDISAVTIDMGFKGSDFDAVHDYCEKISVPYFVEKTNIAEIIFDIRKEKNPCSLCSKMRRGALNSKIIALGYKKIALGHHSDDISETFFLSMLFEGRLSVFAPLSYMDRTGISLIRPMIYIEEKNIRAYSVDAGLPVVHNPCPADKHTQRQYMKDLIKSIQKDIPFAKERIFSAISSPDRYNLWNNVLDKYDSQVSSGANLPSVPDDKSPRSQE